MKAKELIGLPCVGGLNGAKGKIIEARDPPKEAQGMGHIDCLVAWEADELENSWEDLEDLEIVSLVNVPDQLPF